MTSAPQMRAHRLQQNHWCWSLWATLRQHQDIVPGGRQADDGGTLSWNCGPNVLLLTCEWSCVCAGAAVPMQCHTPSAEEPKALGSCSLQSCSSGGSPSHLPGQDTAVRKAGVLQPLTTGGQCCHCISLNRTRHQFPEKPWKICLVLELEILRQMN